MSLVFILPVFSATGTVKFIDPTDSSKDLSWARQGGQVGLQITDGDLNVAVKRVLLPNLASDMIINNATANVTSGSKIFTLSATTTALATATTTTSLISLNDTILIGSETVRKVSSINMTTGAVTVNKPLNNTASAAEIYKVVVSLGSADNCPTCAMAQKVLGTLFAGLGNNIFTLDSVPLIDQGSSGSPMSLANRFATTNADTAINANDLHVDTGAGAAAVGVTVQAAQSSGLVNIGITSATSTFYAVYWGSERNDTGSSVKATSQSDPTGIEVVLTESGPITGIFRGNILATTTSSETTNPPQLKVGVNDVITLKYTDASPSASISTTIKVETTDPVFSNLSPSNATAGQASRPEVEGDITDADSTVTKTTIKVIFAIDNDGDGVLDADSVTGDEIQVVPVDSVDISTTSGGFHVKQRLPALMAPTSNATIYWWLQATDVAGNIGVSDRQPTISGVADTCDDVAFSGFGTSLAGKDVATTADIAGCQPFSILVDFTKPDLTGAVTGSWWDTSKTTTDKTETSVSKAQNTSIRLDFAESLDGTSVQASDFKVAGITPLTATWFSGNKSSIFLGVPALAPDARPKVELAGEIKDVAGNPQTVDSISAAADGIAPTLTVTLTGTGASRPITTGKITISIVANEDIGQPSVSISPILDAATTTTAALGTAVLVAPELKSARTYEAIFTGTTPGLYNVYVTASDTTASNQGASGVNTGAIAFTSTSKALLFEIDTAVAAPVISPANTDDMNTFITIDFAAGGADEGDEYTGTDSVGPTDSSASTNYDTHDTVTIISATLDGVDITPLATTDNKTFLYRSSGLTVASHTVKVKAKDAAGNEKEFTGTVKVAERKPFALALNPGWNLVSIPGEPTDSDINLVISAAHPASTILTYDPSVPGGWLTAVRDNDGLFAGTLTTITSNRAYWILTNSFEAINITIPRLASGAAALPPTVNIVEGWNFVPVLDVTGVSVKSGDVTVAPATYFAGLTLSRAYTFNTVANTWSSVTVASTVEDLSTGKGYWVYATKTGTLVP